jgi:mRNA interferase MazF
VLWIEADGAGATISCWSPVCLETQSVVLVSQVSSVDKTRLGAHIGTLSDERVKQILTVICFLQGLFLSR